MIQLWQERTQNFCVQKKKENEKAVDTIGEEDELELCTISDDDEKRVQTIKRKFCQQFKIQNSACRSTAFYARSRYDVYY